MQSNFNFSLCQIEVIDFVFLNFHILFKIFAMQGIFFLTHVNFHIYWDQRKNWLIYLEEVLEQHHLSYLFLWYHWYRMIQANNYYNFFLKDFSLHLEFLMLLLLIHCKNILSLCHLLFIHQDYIQILMEIIFLRD